VQSDERLDRVRVLRERGQTPKQIARALGIGSGEAGRLVRAAAIAAQAEAPGPALVGCWVSPAWSTGLTVGDQPGWPLHEDPAAGTEGLVAVLVARRHRYGKVSVCGYLADVYCLGVKNALGPEIMDDLGLQGFVRNFFSGYHGAREVVFGSVEYARDLGFDPHPDFAAAEGHLGSWTGPSTITFGKDGKPLYISGPYDDPRPVIRTLERTVGRGNFEFLVVAG
jgi:hypothetical protein